MTGTLENLLLSRLQQYCSLPDPATYIISSAIHICFYHDMHPHLYQFKKIPRRRETTVCLVLTQHVLHMHYQFNTTKDTNYNKNYFLFKSNI